MRELLHWLHEEHGAPKLWGAVPRVPRESPRAVTATDEERSAILTAARPALQCFLLMCSDLAIRSGTAALMAPRNYDRGARRLTFKTKFGTRQTLPVTEALAALFALVPTSADVEKPYVAHLSASGHCQVRNMRKAFKKLLTKIGIQRNLRPHDLRRTTAVKVLEFTKDIRAVQAVLGHKNLATTLYYLDHRNTPVDIATLEAAKLNPTARPTRLERIQ